MSSTEPITINFTDDPAVGAAIDEAAGQIKDTTTLAAGLLIAISVLAVIGFIGFILGIVATVKANQKGSKIFGSAYWLHMVLAVFAGPIEFFTGAVDIALMNKA